MTLNIRLSQRGRWWLKVAGGTVAVILWGLFFDELARVGHWIVASSYVAHGNAAMADLHARYNDAQIALNHGHLYSNHHEAFTYPPITAFAFVPFRWIGLRATMTVWAVGNLVALAVVFAISLTRWFKIAFEDAWLAAGAGLAPAVVFAFYPYRSLLLWGQLGVFLMLLVFLDLFVMPRRFRGILIGLAAAIKLLPALFVVWFLARKEIKAVVRVVAAFFALTLLAAALYPHASALYWFHVLPSVRVGRVTHVTDARWFQGAGRLPDQSLHGLFARPPFLWFGNFPWLPLALAVLAGGIAAVVRLVRQERELVAFVVLSVLTELVSPVSWPHYWVFIGLVPLLAVAEWNRDRPVAIASIAMALATCVDLDDKTLLTLPFTAVSPIALFVVRNIYVLGGLIFLVIASCRAFRTIPTEPNPPEVRALPEDS